MLPNLLIKMNLAALLLLPLVGCNKTSTAESKKDVAKNEITAEVNKNIEKRTNSQNSKNSLSPKQRKFKFVYGATISELKPGIKARVWIPIATSSCDQEISKPKIVSPKDYKITTEKKYGNTILYFEAIANAKGEIPIHVEYDVLRRETNPELVEKVTAADKKTFLTSNSNVPVDGTLLRKVFGNAKPSGDAFEKAYKTYHAIFERMNYDKPQGKPWGQGNAAWACDSKYGNCTDFHSLFISVNRDLNIPAKFEIGFPIPNDNPSGKVGGYHCWAKFADRDQWKGVDISEAAKLKGKKNEKLMREYYFSNLTADRIHFTTGRDLELMPKPTAKTVNFLAYPYVEVDGKVHKNFVKQFTYQNQ